MTQFRSRVPFLVCVAAMAACSHNPAQPSTSSGADAASAALTGSVTVPRPLSPANAAVVRNSDQPVTLVVQNALVTKPGDATYTFEVATDAGFASKVQTKSGIAEGGNGQTSVKLDSLAAATDYYWHARVTSAGTTGTFGATSKFTVGPAIVIQAPVAVSPLTGTPTSGRPSFTVNDAVRQGPAGAITYRFEISTGSSFTSIVATGTVPETAGQTTYTPAVDLGVNTTYYWRATAIDAANNISSAASAAQSFITSLAIDLSQVVTSYPGAPSGAELASWPQTATITVIEQDGNPSAGGPMCVAFTLADYWPSIPYFGDPSVPIYANQWYFANIGGQWYGGPGEYLRSDRSSFCKTGQGTNAIGPDGGWTGPMRTWAPKVGELVGYLISTPARAGMRSINERSNIVLQPWRDTSLGSTSVKKVTR